MWNMSRQTLMRFEASEDVGEIGGLFQEFKEADDVICIELAALIEIDF